MTTRTPGATRTRGIRDRQRLGHVTGRRPPAEGFVRDDETGLTYWFSAADIVTEGLRTVRTGERVRFLIDHAKPKHASYVVRLDLPDITEYYQ